jgi:hypothetical protein
MEAVVTAFEERNETVPPLLIFEPCEESRIPGPAPTPSDAPEELVVVAVGQVVREAVFEALERVEAREPNIPVNPKRKVPKFKDSTPLKSFFRQMAALPATVFSLTFPDDGPDSGTIFFLRTAFTISEFRREVQRPI